MHTRSDSGGGPLASNGPKSRALGPLQLTYPFPFAISCPSRLIFTLILQVVTLCKGLCCTSTLDCVLSFCPLFPFPHPIRFVVHSFDGLVAKYYRTLASSPISRGKPCTPLAPLRRPGASQCLPACSLNMMLTCMHLQGTVFQETSVVEPKELPSPNYLSHLIDSSPTRP